MTAPPRDSDSAQEPTVPEPFTAREIRLSEHVEVFLRQVRQGGSLDPEPLLRTVEDLRDDLAPLLRGVLRLERISDEFNRSRGDSE